MGAKDEQYPQPSRRGRLQRLDLQLIPVHRELPLSTDGGFSFSAGVQEVIKSAVFLIFEQCVFFQNPLDRYYG